MTPKLFEFLAKMSRMTTPEEECASREITEDEFLADMSDERLCGEYATFMEMVREAREVRRELSSILRIDVFTMSADNVDPGDAAPVADHYDIAVSYTAYDGEIHEVEALDEVPKAGIEEALTALTVKYPHAMVHGLPDEES